MGLSMHLDQHLGKHLNKYRIPLAPAPARIKALVAKGVQAGPLTDARDAPRLLNTPHAPQEGVWRDHEGKVLVVCNTDFPDVTPAMIDWWFGWHLPFSERYRLWHPTAHVAARVKEDRSALADHRARYIGNESQVDEYIGKQLKHLAITFVPPALAGFTTLEQQGATAICAVTSDRWLRAEGGRLCHLVLPNGSGCQMRSGFWLGSIRHNMNALHFLLNGIYNSKTLRQRIVSDQFSLDLLQHCAEEMAHLAKILPGLYADMA